MTRTASPHAGIGVVVVILLATLSVVAAKGPGEGEDSGITQIPTSMNVTASPNPAQFGQPVTITAVLSVPSGDSFPEWGTVLFYMGSGLVADRGVNRNLNVTVQRVPAGSSTLTATFLGTRRHSGSSASVVEVVNAAPTATTVTSRENPSVLGRNVDFAVKVTTPEGHATAGVITFSAGSITLGSINLRQAGSAIFRTAALPAGTNTVTASYNGTSEFGNSSGSVTQVVNP